MPRQCVAGRRREGGGCREEALGPKSRMGRKDRSGDDWPSTGEEGNKKKKLPKHQLRQARGALAVLFARDSTCRAVRRITGEAGAQLRHMWPAMRFSFTSSPSSPGGTYWIGYSVRSVLPKPICPNDKSSVFPPTHAIKPGLRGCGIAPRQAGKAQLQGPAERPGGPEPHLILPPRPALSLLQHKTSMERIVMGADLFCEFSSCPGRLTVSV